MFLRVWNTYNFPENLCIFSWIQVLVDGTLQCAHQIAIKEYVTERILR